ncbi:UDP-2,3-diacylglucosamine hydrolase [Catenovulum agarivorans DS-2]|uniref:UDP-2,3-diacylglucosamine hydrolase n=1 Tax=Catenovulum agarivorans DS-2 TaxID=1328313 RepID=W7QNP6_9ALTE|nr:UDP-2,3-diacylglucosamine diphosphatase [Catenovulum agarivorans]EWH09553.1 UDP-2,3-diacylglucosamine hydrolase [Catenovulum agarivorans DS-2]
MSVFFIADLHLSESRPDITQAFLDFIQSLSEQTTALYILGDFFEYWVGDDDPSSWLLPIKSALKNTSHNICPIYFIHGNRDFLIGQRFARETGVMLLEEPSVIELNNQRVVILHGDSLCTQDEGYQKFRKIVRNKFVQFVFLCLPLKMRFNIFAKGREQSKHKQQQVMDMQILDVTQTAVSQLMDAYQVDLMIHGHTHRPNIHRNARRLHRGTRIVLGDWYTQGSVLEVNQDGFLLNSFPLVTS